MKCAGSSRRFIGDTCDIAETPSLSLSRARWTKGADGHAVCESPVVKSEDSKKSPFRVCLWSRLYETGGRWNVTTDAFSRVLSPSLKAHSVAAHLRKLGMLRRLRYSGLSGFLTSPDFSQTSHASVLHHQPYVREMGSALAILVCMSN